MYVKKRIFEFRASSLEPERGEEPTVLAARVTLLKELLERLLGILSLRHTLTERLGANESLELLHLQRVTGGHQVVVVGHLDEGLDLAPLAELLGTHPLADLQRVSLDTGNDDVRVRPLAGSVVVLLDDNDLFCEEMRCKLRSTW